MNDTNSLLPKNDVLPNDKEAARKLKVQATHFILIKNILYKRGFS